MTAPTLEFDRATEADVDALVDLVQAAYRGDASRGGWTTEADLLDGQRVDASMVRDALGRAEVRVVCGRRDGQLVACCELRHEPDRRTVHLGMFAVRPGIQGEGLGRSVLAEGERVAAETWRARRLELSVISARAELIAWYERRGYERTGETAPFPYGDERFGLPRRDDLSFSILAKALPG